VTSYQNAQEGQNQPHSTHVGPLPLVPCPALPKGLESALFGFQKVGVSFFATSDRCLLADEQGLGKTVQAIAWLATQPDIKPVLVVCPATVKLVWENEIKKWVGEKSVVLSGRSSVFPYTPPRWLVINYDILADWEETLLAMKPEAIIFDESAYIKSRKTKRTRSATRMARRIPRLICLSGTPVKNRPAEIWTSLNMIDPKAWPSFWRFAERYCDAKKTPWGWTATGATHIDELYGILISKYMLRREKKDVLKDLPDKIRSVVPLPLTNQPEYDIASENFIAWLKTVTSKEKVSAALRALAFVKLEKLKQLIIEGKLAGCLDWLSDCLETEEKVVVFTTHKATVAALMSHCEKFHPVKIDGGTSMADRGRAIDDFQNKPEVRVLIGNLQAAGTGITLTAARVCVFVELGWSPADHLQAEDRLHRVGQKNAVLVHYLIAPGTVEEKIVNLINKKAAVVRSVLAGDTGDDLLLELTR
jgi:SWI/SNF-related matrix-associated actin-dependent regulator 1 of chromatin subfamily A